MASGGRSKAELAACDDRAFCFTGTDLQKRQMDLRFKFCLLQILK